MPKNAFRKNLIYFPRSLTDTAEDWQRPLKLPPPSASAYGFKRECRFLEPPLHVRPGQTPKSSQRANVVQSPLSDMRQRDWHVSFVPTPEVGQQLGQKQTKAARIAPNGLTSWAASHCEALRCGAKRCGALRLRCGARPTLIHIGLHSPHHKLRTKI